MRNKLLVLFPLILACFNIRAQVKKVNFHSINTAGIVIGESGTDMMLQSVNGVTYKNFYSGIGFGKDDYHYNSYPLFFDQRVYFGKKNAAFAYGDLGFNFNGKNKPGKETGYYNSYHFRGGIFTDFGIGYKMKFIRKSFFTISSGFTYKEINDKVGVTNLCLTQGPCYVDYSNYKYGDGRVVLKAGVDF